MANMILQNETSLAELPSDTLLTRARTSEFLGLKPGTLANWACKGEFDLPIVKIGKAVRYRVDDVRGFIERNRQSA
jgi:hypothetical protein